MPTLHYRQTLPKIGSGVFIAPNAYVIGDVEIGEDSSVWFGSVIRGDVFHIRIGARTNIQDNCTLHVTGGTAPVIIEDEVTMGHAVVAHGCTIRRRALIGMGSRILDGAVVGEEAIVGAGALVPEGFHVPPRTLVLGVPAKVIRPLTGKDLVRATEGIQHYVDLKEEYLASLAKQG